jgi:hypothetical protein
MGPTYCAKVNAKHLLLDLYYLPLILLVSWLVGPKLLYLCSRYDLLSVQDIIFEHLVHAAILFIKIK